MNLDRLTIEIRPRRAWEAVDLGVLMARRWWWPMMKVWLLLTLPLFVLLNFLPSNWMWLSITLIWWLKPLLERPLLHILSQAVFDHLPDTRSTLRAFPRLAWRQVFSSLTWRRFSPTRSMDLPVIQLEGLGGTRRRERLNILHREDSAPATWLTIIGIHLEGFLGLGLAMLLYVLIPSEIHIDWLNLFTSQDAGWFVLLTNSCNYLAMTLVAPFYVACGFALYLNRRIKLEAWDIDIAFQRIVNKRRAKRTTLLPAIFLVIMLGAGLAQAPASWADTATTTSTPQASYTRDSAKAGIEEIVAGDEFIQKKTFRYPVFFEREPQPVKEDGFWDWLFELFKSAEQMAALASGLELVLWAAVLCLIFFLIFRYRHWLAAYLPQSVSAPAPRNKPLTLFGMDITRESLPADVSASALELLHARQERAALALLYRASLSRLVEGGLDIDDGHTEEECLHIATEYAQNHTRTTAAITYFAHLTRAWQRLAYGHLPPDAAAAEQLCQKWNGVWRLTSTDTGADHD